MQGAVLKFYWDSILDDVGSSFSVTSTSTGDYALTSMTNWMEVNRWKASSSATQNFIYEGATTKEADYFAIAGHNLNTAGATITLQASSSTAFAGEQSTIFIEAPGNDRSFLKEFTSPGQGIKAWKIILSGQTTACYISVCALGTRTELDYINPSFDPYAQEIKANTNMSYGGYVTGTHVKYTERQVNILLSNKTTSIYNKVKTWWETHQLKNFFMTWDITNDSTNIWLMRGDERFNNPISVDQYRNINLNLIGRKE